VKPSPEKGGKRGRGDLFKEQHVVDEVRCKKERFPDSLKILGKKINTEGKGKENCGKGAG